MKVEHRGAGRRTLQIGGLALLVMACARAAAQPAPRALPAATLRGELERMERQGRLPQLDRSTDVRGPDANRNGVRDDIEAFMAALPLTATQHAAALQTARNQQAKLLVDTSNKPAVVRLSQQSMAAIKCMADVFVGAAMDWSDDLSLKIEAITANTRERAQRYMRYMAALSGTPVSYPRGNTCEE